MSSTMPAPWLDQSPIDIIKLVNLLTSVETYLRPRAISPTNVHS